jgi:hypothetical protein
MGWSKWTSSLVLLLGLPRPLFADASLPIVAAPEEPPITCGSARSKEMQKALAAWCAATSDEEERHACRVLGRAFRRCARELVFFPEYDYTHRVKLRLPDVPERYPFYAAATFAREGRSYRVVSVEEYEDCP